MNKKIFASEPTSKLTVNQAGGKAYSFEAQHALAQLVTTGCLNDTYYATAESQLDKIKELADKCDDTYVAKAAVYAHQQGKMKDAPALLLGILIGRRNHALVAKVFDRVITNQKMLRNLVQTIRSGVLGYKSFGTRTKNLIQNWLSKKSGDELFRGAIGQSPSLKDIVKLTHPKPENKTKEAFYGWLLGKKEVSTRNLPSQVKLFEKFKQGKCDEVPDVDFRALTALDLTQGQWEQIAYKMPWNALRMNINTLARHNVFTNKDIVDYVAKKLSDKEEVLKNNAFPYQLMTTYQNISDDIPTKIKLALQQAVEHATLNVPSLNGKTVVLVDISGSMNSRITGQRKGSTTKTTCVDVAALIAASILRKNVDAKIICFDTKAKLENLNPLDSIMTNAKILNKHGGGTDCACGLQYIVDQGWDFDNFIMVSDNESWAQQSPRRYRTGMSQVWQSIRNKNKNAKLVCLDIQPGITSQVMDSKSVLNIGSFTDGVFEVIESFFNGNRETFASQVENVKI